ncbi:hypothetical protein FAIPA1_20206 [Frankia sp. AiPs1]
MIHCGPSARTSRSPHPSPPLTPLPTSRFALSPGILCSTSTSLVLLARIDAARGDRALCERRVARLRAEVGPYGIDLLDPYAEGALGLAVIGHGDHDVATVALTDAWVRARQLGIGCPVSRGRRRGPRRAGRRAGRTGPGARRR